MTNGRKLSIARLILDEEDEIVRALMDKGEIKEVAKKEALYLVKKEYAKFDS